MSVDWAMIMAGGSGTRFWPVGRRERPKQLLAIQGEETLIQSTVRRIPASVGKDKTLVLTRADQLPLLAEQVDLPAANLIGEPSGRDTCACIALAAALVEKRDPGAVMAVMPADHLIAPEGVFHDALSRAATAAREHDALVTFGVRPTHAATGYGYLEAGEELASGLFDVSAFREKPDRATAEDFLARGGFFWNAGIFVWRARTILDEVARCQPEIAERVEDIVSGGPDAEFAERLAARYGDIPKTSIDFGVMENARRVLTVAADFDWDDIGSLVAVERHNPRDESGNTLRGETLGLDIEGCILDNRAEGIVAAIGVKDLVIVRTGDAVLVAPKDQAERVKEIVHRLEAEGRDERL